MTIVYQRMEPGQRNPGWVSGFVRRYEVGLRRGEVAVPCGTCTACCRSPKVELRPDELIRFPDHEDGFLPHKADGTCSRFIDGKCSIYATRPHACKIYDCRLANLFGIMPAEDPIMLEAHQQWARFREPMTGDTDMRVAIRLAVSALGATSVPQAKEALRIWPQYLEQARALRRAGMTR